MSTTILRLIPTDPNHVPQPTVQRRARDLLISFVPRARDVSVTVTDEVEFVDQGGNFERILCPNCGAVYCDEDNPHGWWQEAMDKAYEQSHFRDLMVTMPCCGAMCSLNDLRYEWPAGFARFVLEAADPWGDLSEEMIASLEQVLGCRLRKIVARY